MALEPEKDRFESVKKQRMMTDKLKAIKPQTGDPKRETQLLRVRLRFVESDATKLRSRLRLVEDDADKLRDRLRLVEREMADMNEQFKRTLKKLR
jgi:hypothetical protein